MKKPTILAAAQGHTARDLEASRRSALDAVKVAAWHADACRQALAPRAVGKQDIAAARSALAEIAKSITAARQALDVQRRIIRVAEQTVGAETPEQMAAADEQMKAAEGRAKGAREANAVQSKRSAEVAEAIRTEWGATRGTQAARCAAVRKLFTKKAEAARRNGEPDEISERAGRASNRTILRAIGVRSTKSVASA